MEALPDIAATLEGDVVRLAAGAEVPADAGAGTVLAVDGLPAAPLATLEALGVAAKRGATVLLRVTSASVTGEGALEELRGLLPSDHVVWREVPLRGGAVVRDGEPVALDSVTVADEPASHHVLVFGPRASEVRPAAAVAPADLAAERAEIARLRSDLAVARARTGESSPTP